MKYGCEWAAAVKFGIPDAMRFNRHGSLVIVGGGVGISVDAVDVDTTRNVFKSGPPRKLFATGLSMANENPDVLVDATGDGERLLARGLLPGNAPDAASHDPPSPLR